MEENCQHRYFKIYVTFSSIIASIFALIIASIFASIFSSIFSLYPLYYKIIKLLLSKITMDKKLYLFLFFYGKKEICPITDVPINPFQRLFKINMKAMNSDETFHA